MKQEYSSLEETPVKTPATNLQKKFDLLERPPPPSAPPKLTPDALRKPRCAATQTEVHVREEGAQTTTSPLTTGTLLKPQCAGTQTGVHVRDKGAQATTGPALRASKQTSTSRLTVEKSVQTPLPPSEGAVVNLLVSVYTKACTRVLQLTTPTLRDAAVGNALVTCSASTQTLARRFNAEEAASWLNSRHQEALRSGAWHLHLSTSTTTASSQTVTQSCFQATSAQTPSTFTRAKSTQTRQKVKLSLDCATQTAGKTCCHIHADYDYVYAGQLDADAAKSEAEPRLCHPDGRNEPCWAAYKRERRRGGSASTASTLPTLPIHLSDQTNCGRMV